MKISCGVHGEVEAEPDMNGVVHCPACFSQAVRKFMDELKADQSMTSHASKEDFEFFFECGKCGSQFPDGHVHGGDECIVHGIMNS